MQKRNYLYPGPPWGPEDEERRGEAGGDVWMDKLAGWIARCGQILAQPPEEVGGRLKSLSISFTASLKPKDSGIKVGHD